MKKVNMIAAGFIRRKDLDFSDDGNYFRGYEYAGMPISYLADGDQRYISVRWDYLDHEFTFYDFKDFEEYRLCDKFNGVSVEDVDLDELKDICVKVAKKIKELNETVLNETIDIEPLCKRLDKESALILQVTEEFKKEFKWWAVSKYQLSWLAGYLKDALDERSRVEKLHEDMINGDVDCRSLRHYAETYKMYGYVMTKNDDFYLREMQKALKEQNKEEK